MAVRLASYLHRNRFGIFYFRRVIPPDIRKFFAFREVYRSLATASSREAAKAARVLSARIEVLFDRLRSDMAGKKKEDDGLRAEIITRIDLGDIKFEFESEAHELDDVKALISHTRSEHLPVSKKCGTEGFAEAPRLYALFDKYLTELRTSLRPESFLDYQGDFNQFRAILGDISVDEINHEAMNRAKETLTRLPSNINKAAMFRGRSIEEILALGMPPQSIITVRKKWTRLQAFFNWAIDHGYTNVNYARGKKPKGKTGGYERFNSDELRHLFDSRDYKEGLSTEAFQYWLPLIGLYTGARLEEIAQLHLADIRQQPQSGIWYFDITEEIEQEAGASQTKRLKNQNSARICPVHPALVEAGLITYVNDLKARGYDRLFPELRQDTYGKVGARASEWFTDYRRRCGVGSVKGPSKKTFHSFRHTLITALSYAGVTQERREVLAGHGSKSINVSVYTDTPLLTTLYDDLKKAQFAIDISYYRFRESHETKRRKKISSRAKKARS